MPYAIRCRRAALLAVVALGASGCGDDDPTGPDELAPCTGNVTVTVSAGTTPTVTWAPACTMYGLLVEDNADDLWMLRATGSAGIAPGVRYGTVPAGAEALLEPAVPLVAGRTYGVFLFRGATDDDATLAGAVTFTP